MRLLAEPVLGGDGFDDVAHILTFHPQQLDTACAWKLNKQRQRLARGLQDDRS